ncbi:MAG: 50S ribosomal protein L25/general stress protein Ctc [Porticoccaceae bacterium]
MVDFSLNAKARDDKGKGASRRLRRLADEIPAIVYGGNGAPQAISLVHKDVVHSLENESFYSHIISLSVDGKAQDVILKDIQRHPARPVILHMDFLRVDRTEKLQTRIPLHFINEATAVGVKQGGGIVSHLMTELEIQCLPQDLPEFIEVDLAGLDVGQILHISDIKMPKGVESVSLSHGADHNLPVATVIKPRGAAEADESGEPEE